MHIRNPRFTTESFEEQAVKEKSLILSSKTQVYKV